jgi:geranylgeranyl diphosphate synthase type II
LVGDALQALSFEILSNNYKKIKKTHQIILINSFAQYVGQDGMVGGQAIDIDKNQNNLSIEKLLEMYKLKTANLISFSCQVGGIVSGAEQKKVNALKNFGDNLGIAFQISDDILDIIGDENVTGKRVGSDLKNNKKTFLNFFDIDESKREIKKYCDLSISSLKIFGPVPETLLGLVNFIREREF